MSPPLYTVYKIVNEDNGRLYIGMTAQALKRRYGQHMRSPNKRMAADMSRVPEPELIFKIHPLETTHSRYIAKTKERQYIREFNTLTKAGYNTLAEYGTSDPKFHVLRRQGRI